jgi:hypothetical protein
VERLGRVKLEALRARLLRHDDGRGALERLPEEVAVGAEVLGVVALLDEGGERGGADADGRDEAAAQPGGGDDGEAPRLAVGAGGRGGRRLEEADQRLAGHGLGGEGAEAPPGAQEREVIFTADHSSLNPPSTCQICPVT